MGLSNSTPVYDYVPTELIIQFATIYNKYDIYLHFLSLYYTTFHPKLPISNIKTH